VKPLIRAVSDRDANVRIAAVNALGRLGAAAAVELLIKRYGDEDDVHVRIAIGDSLRRIEHPAARRWTAEQRFLD
jgi:HEAT repeat protein